jgi:exopolyphosphatase/guanosine-5'-triphosphate,3'-diphosphate pyrophosphatase
MRVAAIDCGTNSVRLLIADSSPSGLIQLHREMRIVRLGEGVDRSGMFAAAALERTRVALVDYAATIASFGAQRLRLVATSASRDAVNRDDFVAIVTAALAVLPEVVSGTEEAALSFAGAAGTLPGILGSGSAVLVADIGGGSTELVLGGGDEPLRAHSMDVGAVRLTERHLHDDPPTPAQIDATVADVREALELAASEVAIRSQATLVGVAGTVTTLAAIALGLTEYSSAAIHGARLRAAEISAITDRLLSLDHAGRAAIRVIHPGRVDVICAGALILRTLAEATGAQQLIVSEHDILDGIALSLLD